MWWFGQVSYRSQKPFVSLMNGNGTCHTMAANLSPITEGDGRLLVARHLHNERPWTTSQENKKLMPSVQNAWTHPRRGAHWSGQILSSGYGKFTVELQVDNQTHCNKGVKPSTQILWRFAQQNPLITPLLKPIPSAFDLSTAGTSQQVIAGILFCSEFYLEEKWLHSLQTTNHSWWVKWLLRYRDNAYRSGDREFYGSAWSKLKRYAICEEDKRILQWGGMAEHPAQNRLNGVHCSPSA